MIRNNLTKLDIAKNLINKTGFSAIYSKKLINDFLNILNLKLKNGNLNLKNIGVFKKISKKNRPGRNPATKEKFNITARISLSFIASKKLLDNLNKSK